MLEETGCIGATLKTGTTTVSNMLLFTMYNTPTPQPYKCAALPTTIQNTLAPETTSLQNHEHAVLAARASMCTAQHSTEHDASSEELAWWLSIAVAWHASVLAYALQSAEFEATARNLAPAEIAACTMKIKVAFREAVVYELVCLQSTYDGPPKLIVFGGNGFVGTRVCEEALNTGLAVVSISRSAAPKASAYWTSQVDWVSVSLCCTNVCWESALTHSMTCYAQLAMQSAG